MNDDKKTYPKLLYFTNRSRMNGNENLEAFEENIKSDSVT